MIMHYRYYAILKKIPYSSHNKKLLKVYSELVKLFAKEPTEMLSEDENEKDYIIIILEICEILLISYEV